MAQAMTSRLQVIIFISGAIHCAGECYPRNVTHTKRTSLGTQVLIVAFLNDSTTQLVTVLLLLRRYVMKLMTLTKEEALSRTDTLPLS